MKSKHSSLTFARDKIFLGDSVRLQELANRCADFHRKWLSICDDDKLGRLRSVVEVDRHDDGGRCVRTQTDNDRKRLQIHARLKFLQSHQPKLKVVLILNAYKIDSHTFSPTQMPSTASSVVFVKTSSTEIILGEKTETVRVKRYVALNPSPANLLNNSCWVCGEKLLNLV